VKRQNIELELRSMTGSSSWAFANISKTFCPTTMSFVRLPVGGKMGLMRCKPVHQLIVLKPRIALKQGGQRLTSVSGDLAFVFISCHMHIYVGA